MGLTQINEKKPDCKHLEKKLLKKDVLKSFLSTKKCLSKNLFKFKNEKNFY